VLCCSKVGYGTGGFMKQNEKSTLINWGEIANFVTNEVECEKEKI
jgi:hypothetical protein